MGTYVTSLISGGKYLENLQELYTVAFGCFSHFNDSGNKS